MPIASKHANTGYLKIFLTIVAFLPLACSAATVQTLDGKNYEGDLKLDSAGAFQITTIGGAVQRVALTNLFLVRFANGEPLTGGHLLASGWRAQDFGKALGVTRQDGGVFQMRVAAGGTNGDDGHFVSRSLTVDGEVVARVGSLGVADGTATAGVMIREAFEDSVRFVAVTVGSDGNIRFLRRGGKERVKVSIINAKATLPCWLKLVKREKTFESYHSKDGKKWETNGVEAMEFTGLKGPVGVERHQPALQAQIGLLAASTAAFHTSTAIVDQVQITFLGLQGEYFSNSTFQHPALSRIDSGISFNWALGSPDPALEPDNFSVRWTGFVTPKFSENFSFLFDADDAARLWVNGSEVPQTDFKKSKNEPAAPLPIPLKAGEKYSLKMEYKETDGVALVRLGWSSRSQSREVIPSSQLSWTYDAASAGAVVEPQSILSEPLVRGVLLRHGSFLAGEVASADDATLKMAFAGQKELSISLTKLARVNVRATTLPVPLGFTTSRKGVFFRNGDFFEGEFKSLAHGALKVSSVLFGLKNFWLGKADVLGIAFNDLVPVPFAYEVRLVDGSVLKVSSITLSENSILVDDLSLGMLKLPLAACLEIEKSTAASPVAALRP